MKPSLHITLTKSLRLLEQRKMMIPRYVNQDSSFVGKNHYSMEMLEPLQKEIDEMKAAIAGIDVWRKTRRQKSEIDNPKSEIS